MASVSEFGYFSEALRSKQGFTAPVVYMEKDEIKAAGAALFNRKAQMVGIADEYETIGGKIWRNKLTQGLIVVSHPDKPETIVVFEIAESKTTVKPEFSGDTVRFIVEGEFIGSLGENMPMEEKPFIDEKSVNAIAQTVATELTNHTYATFTKLQTVHADSLALGDLIRRKNPQYWEKIKDRWEDEIFPTVEADVTIKVKIRGSGMIF
jgi:Ger(x)C family germination protein